MSNYLLFVGAHCTRAFGFLKIFFFSNRPKKSFFYPSQNVAFGLTIPKGYNTWVLKIVVEIFWKKHLKKYLKKYLWKKYLQTFISIPRCYTILALWDQMQHFGFDKKRILGDLNKNIFLNPKGGPFGSEETVFAVQGVILPKKIFCVFGSLSNMSKSGLRILVCLNFHMTHLSH